MSSYFPLFVPHTWRYTPGSPSRLVILYESTLQGVKEPRAAHLKDQGGNLIFLVFLFSHAQTLRHRMGGMNSMGHGRIPKKEENEGNQQQTDGHDTIYNPPYQHNRSPPYILFLCHSRTGSESPPKHQGPEGLVCVCTMQASIACHHVSMYTAGECVRWGLKERKGKEESGEQRRDPLIDRAAALLAKVWDVLYS